MTSVELASCGIDVPLEQEALRSGPEVDREYHLVSATLSALLQSDEMPHAVATAAKALSPAVEAVLPKQRAEFIPDQGSI
jgi:hypothetical protein